MELETIETEEMETEEEETEFDRELPGAHSYLPGGLTEVRGRSVLEAGWEGRVPCWAHHAVVFPGESVPMHCPDLGDLDEFRHGLRFVQSQRLFGLLFPDESRVQYGVLCEVTEATEPFEDNIHTQISFKAQARQRFKTINRSKRQPPFLHNRFLNHYDIKTLPDIILYDPLQGIASLSSNCQQTNRVKSIRKADSAVTPWPHFVYDLFDLSKIIPSIKTYFKELSLDNLPDDVLSLSYWVASNLPIPVDDHLKLFKIDNALLRLFVELKYLKKSKLFCQSCASLRNVTKICTVEEIVPMSKEGPHSNYCNVGGYVHSVITVKETENVSLQGEPSLEFTWFPGYYWTIATCSQCHSHMGWKFTAAKKSLRPQSFWGLTSNSITTRKTD